MSTNKADVNVLVAVHLTGEQTLQLVEAVKGRDPKDYFIEVVTTHDSGWTETIVTMQRIKDKKVGITYLEDKITLFTI